MQLSAFPFSTILFDLDSGTLVDSAPDVLEAIAPPSCVTRAIRSLSDGALHHRPSAGRYFP